MILDLCLLKGGVPMDVISEIIAYEKHAEEIVAQANKKPKPFFPMRRLSVKKNVSSAKKNAVTR